MKIILLFFIFTLFFSCKEEKFYTTTVEINRIEIVRFDDQKNPMVLDVEINYPKCPGTQIEIFRGNQEFAKCVLSKYKKRDQVNAEIHWYWNTLGYYQWDIVKLGDCIRWKDPLDEVSYEMIEECEDYNVYGAKVGFVCRKIPTRNLLAACPWFRRE